MEKQTNHECFLGTKLPSVASAELTLVQVMDTHTHTHTHTHRHTAHKHRGIRLHSMCASWICGPIFQEIPTCPSCLTLCISHQEGRYGLSWGTLAERYLSRWRQCSFRLLLSDKRVPLPALLYHNTAVEWSESPNVCRYLLCVWSSIKTFGKKIRDKGKTNGGGGGGEEV